eukprot:m.212211 g.212211  ORF g.212211 m.212211 type:complete len:70 (-) comp33120_c5_seq1:387-596(-)
MLVSIELVVLLTDVVNHNFATPKIDPSQVNMMMPILAQNNSFFQKRRHAVIQDGSHTIIVNRVVVKCVL